MLHILEILKKNKKTSIPLLKKKKKTVKQPIKKIKYYKMNKTNLKLINQYQYILMKKV